MDTDRYTFKDCVATSLCKLLRRKLFVPVYAMPLIYERKESPVNNSYAQNECTRITVCPEKNHRTKRHAGKIYAGLTGSRADIGKSVVADSQIQMTGINNEACQSVGPGLLRHIHNAARRRLPQCFEGGCVSVKQGSNWVLGHTFSFSSVSPGGYKALLTRNNREHPDLPYLVVEAAPGGHISCEIRVSPTDMTRAMIVAQIAKGEFLNFETVFDAYCNSSTASVISLNREFIALHYLLALTQKFSFGVELVAKNSISALNSASLAGRWDNKNSILSATLGDRGLDLCVARTLKPYLTVAAMLEVGFTVRRAVGTLAYEWVGYNYTFRGSVDSDGLVGATLHRSLGGKRARLGCAISALYNHPNDKFRLGFGINAAIID